MNHRPRAYESPALPLSYSATAGILARPRELGLAACSCATASAEALELDRPDPVEGYPSLVATPPAQIPPRPGHVRPAGSAGRGPTCTYGRPRVPSSARRHARGLGPIATKPPPAPTCVRPPRHRSSSPWLVIAACGHGVAAVAADPSAARGCRPSAADARRHAAAAPSATARTATTLARPRPRPRRSRPRRRPDRDAQCRPRGRSR